MLLWFNNFLLMSQHKEQMQHSFITFIFLLIFSVRHTFFINAAQFSVENKIRILTRVSRVCVLFNTQKMASSENSFLTLSKIRDEWHFALGLETFLWKFTDSTCSVFYFSSSIVKIIKFYDSSLTAELSHKKMIIDFIFLSRIFFYRVRRKTNDPHHCNKLPCHGLLKKRIHNYFLWCPCTCMCVWV